MLFIESVLPVQTTGGETSVRISKNKTKTPTIRPNRLIKSISVILTAFADLTLKMTDILQNKKDNSVLKIEKKRVYFLVFLQFLSGLNEFLCNISIYRMKVKLWTSRSTVKRIRAKLSDVSVHHNQLYLLVNIAGFKTLLVR